jgi:hypothetical protein
MKDLIALLLLEFYERLPIALIQRETPLKELPGKISVVIGMRRVGKTYFLYQRIQQLIGEGVDPKSIFYLNLEDDRLPELGKGVLASLVDGFYSLYPQNHTRHCWLFFDEIQMASDWPNLLRRLLDTKKVSIFATGSSSRLLSKEIATTLRGRAIATEVWPFSLQEYAKARVYEVPKEPMSQRAKDEFCLFFDEYLLSGGFPETVNYTEIDQKRVHQDYVSVAILKDIIERHKIKNERLLRYLIKFMLTNVAKPISFNKLFNDLKSQGQNLGKNTLYEYFDHISDCYLSFLVPLYTESTRKQESNPRKAYAIDTGLSRSHMIGISENMGRLFENLIYLDFRRHNYDICYYSTKAGREVDFVARSLEGESRVVQVCLDAQDPETHEREVSALSQAESELGIPGTLVTRNNYLSFLSNL